jgi:hypothetical protein
MTNCHQNAAVLQQVNEMHEVSPPQTVAAEAPLFHSVPSVSKPFASVWLLIRPEKAALPEALPGSSVGFRAAIRVNP